MSKMTTPRVQTSAQPAKACDAASLKKALPDASQHFIRACLDEGLSLEEAGAKWADDAQPCAQSIQKTLVAETTSSVSFESLIEEIQTRENCSRGTAIRLAAREHPDRHKAWLLE